jgi:hypothetical protein
MSRRLTSSLRSGRNQEEQLCRQVESSVLLICLQQESVKKCAGPCSLCMNNGGISKQAISQVGGMLVTCPTTRLR